VFRPLRSGARHADVGPGSVRDVRYAAGLGTVVMDDGTQVVRLSGCRMPGLPRNELLVPPAP